MGTNKDEGTLFLYIGPLVIPGLELPLNNSGLTDIFTYFFNRTGYLAVGIMCRGAWGMAFSAPELSAQHGGA